MDIPIELRTDVWRVYITNTDGTEELYALLVPMRIKED